MMAVSFGLACLFALIISQASAQTTSCDNSKGNYTSNSTYHTNLNTLLSSFSSYTKINYGFYNLSYGQNPDRAYAIGLCSGDLNTDDCLNCLNDSRVFLTKGCPNQKVAIVWNGKCWLRYSNRSIFGVVEYQPLVQLVTLKNVTGSVDQFDDALERLMRNLTQIAASGDSRRKDATGTASAPDFQTIYGYVQCVPDISSEQCKYCLADAISLIPSCCTGMADGNVLRPSCRIRFDPYLFYNATLKLDPDAPTLTPLPSPSPNTSSHGNNNTSRIIIAIAVPVACVVLVLSFICTRI